MNKELIKKRFTRKLSSYEEHAKIQKQMAEKLLSYIPKDRKYNTILEIGCGTGLFTKLINDNIKYDYYYANDIVEECESYIKKINSDIIFTPEDIEKYIQKSDKKFDLIVSNASMQWIEEFEDFIKVLLSKLEPNGILVFSTFGTENFREIYYVIGKTLP